MRDKAIEDRTQFSQAELDWLEVTADEGQGEFNKLNFETDNQPIDMHAPDGPAKVRRIDIRDRPEAK